MTALHLASQANCVQNVEALLQLKANPQALNTDEKTAMEIAASKEVEDVFRQASLFH